MSPTKRRTLVGLSVLLGAASLPTLALAQAVGSVATINGGGSTLLGPYWIQIAYCYADNNTSFYKPGTTSPFSPKVTLVTPATPDCTPIAANSGKFGVGFDGTGSGAGQAGFLAHAAVPGTPFSPANPGGNLTTSSTILFGSSDNAGSATAEVYPSLQYALSDNSLVDSDIGVYQAGTNQNYQPPHGRPAITTAANYRGLTFTPGSNQHVLGTVDYPVPATKYGAAIQFPVAVDPVVVAFNKKYKGRFVLKLNNNQLRLDAEAYCKIFSGQITDWGDDILTALNGGTSLKDPSDTGSAPITLVGRSDGSGTTSIFTRHLAAVCAPYTSGFGNAGVTNITSLPTSISSKFTLVSGSGAVASTISTTAGAIGYIGSDYVYPYNVKSGTNNFNLPGAYLKNARGQFVRGTSTSAATAYAAILPPQSDASGNYAPSNTTFGYRDDPTAWVQSTSATAPIANPQANNAYPIVGTTNFLGYTCYASGPQLSLASKFLSYVQSGVGRKTLLNVGLSTLPTSFTTAIRNTFLSNKATDGSAQLNLFFAQGKKSVNPNCSTKNGA